MTEQEILEASEEEVVVKTDELEEEAPSEEEEALPEEVVEEVAEATEEESFEEVVEKEVDEPSTNDILIEVVKTLSGLEGRLTSIEEKMTTPDLSEEVAELKSIIEAKEAEIAAQDRVEAAEKEAEIEAEVSKRVAERVAGIPTAKAEASPKSLSPSVESKPKTGTTRFDPTPEVSKGMNGLASWLEHQLSTKRGA